MRLHPLGKGREKKTRGREGTVTLEAEFGGPPDARVRI